MSIFKDTFKTIYDILNANQQLFSLFVLLTSYTTL